MKTHEHAYYYTGVLSKIEETFNNFVSFEKVFGFRIIFSFVQLRTRLCVLHQNAIVWTQTHILR